MTDDTPVLTEAEKLDMLTQWYNAQAKAKEAKAAIDSELVLRKKVFEAFFTSPKEGVNTLPLAGGYELRAEHKISRTVDRELMHDALQAALISANEGGFSVALDKCFRAVPELVVKEYKALPDSVRKSLDLCVTAKPGAPTLEIKPPKQK
ncbi:hypothetical protein [Microcystis phage Me-ZS1]|nr:hypothetical protein [Microcystis phage Me-ZS1]